MEESAAARRPTRAEAIATGIALVVGVLAAVLPPVRAVLTGVGFVALEIVSMVLDRPTSLVVAGYLACAAIAVFVDVVQPERGPLRSLGWFSGVLGLLGGLYLLAFAVLLRPGALAGVVAVAAGAWWVRRGRSTPVPRLPPIVALFVVLHLLVEGTAGHILTPYLHRVNAALAHLSFGSPVAYDALLGGALGGIALLVAPQNLSRSAGLIAAAAVLGALLPGAVPWVALLAAAGLIGANTADAARPLVTWLHLDPLRSLHALGPLLGLALLVVTAHYGASIWRCDTVGAEGADLAQLSALDGTFDLEPTRDGAAIVVTRREPQEVVVLGAQGGVVHRLSTRESSDSTWNHTEPETLVATEGSRVLLLLASSDSETGNRLVRFDASTGAIDGTLAGLGEGVSDLRRDRRGGVWLSTEFAGRIAQVDPVALNLLSDRSVRGAETNAIAVDVDGGRAWSTGLWMDEDLRRIDLATGTQTTSAHLGTRQWDLAWDPVSDRIYIPRLMDGVVAVRDANTLQPAGTWEVGFGVRPIEVSDDGRFLVVGNLYTGEVSGWDLTTAERTVHAYIGGHIKGLRLDAKGRVLAGSNCGVFALTPTAGG